MGHFGVKNNKSRHLCRKGLLVWTAMSIAPMAQAAVLPEDRADVMYHRYSGGGVSIDGPSLLVRKEIANTVSVSANYYVDSVSSASIDVEASGASEYSEERTEYSVGADYLRDKSILSAGYTHSAENDYEAETVFFGISQDFFGDLTTVSMRYAAGQDKVMQTGNTDFEEAAERQNFRLGISQIATRSLLFYFNYETITDEGYLNNPYRSYRFLAPGDATRYLTATEVYPETRTSDAATLGGKFYLPYRAAMGLHYRFFTDDWDINAHTLTLEYTHPLRKNFILDARVRHYQQTAAHFYSDLFLTQSQDDKDFRARDKELSEYTTLTFGFGVSYTFNMDANGWTDQWNKWVEKSAISFHYDVIQFDYDNFTDLIQGKGKPGEEPLYSFKAEVIRLFFSIWY